jgi:hypothetical protein
MINMLQHLIQASGLLFLLRCTDHENMERFSARLEGKFNSWPVFSLAGEGGGDSPRLHTAFIKPTRRFH